MLAIATITSGYRRVVRLSQIRDFVATIEAGSLRAAARRIGVSQPAMTKSIQQLEDELGVQLLQRSTRGAIPTHSGRAFLERARVVLSELRKVEDDLSEIRGERGGTVAIGLAPAASMLLAPAMVVRFRRRYAEARIRIVEGALSSLLPQVREETLDFCVGTRVNFKFGPALRFKPLYAMHLVVACRRGHALRNARALKDLADASWLVLAPLTQGRLIEEAFTAAGLPPPRVVVQCESYAPALALMAKTDMLGLVFPQLLSEPFMCDVLQQIRLDKPLPALIQGLYMRTEARLTPPASAMVSAVIAACRRLVHPR